MGSTPGKPKLGFATPFPQSSLLRPLEEPYYYARPNTSVLDTQGGPEGGSVNISNKTFQDGETIGHLSYSPEKAASKSDEVATDECSSMEDQLHTDLSGSLPGRFSRSALFEDVNKLVAKTVAVRGEGEVGTIRSHEKPQTAGPGSKSLTSPPDLSQRVKPALRKRKAVIRARSSDQTEDSESEYFYGVSTKNAFLVWGTVHAVPPRVKKSQGRLTHKRA